MAGQPMGGHTDSNQATLFQEIDFVSQGCDVGEFERSRFFSPSPLKFRESAYKRREARFLVFTLEPRPMPSPKRSLHREIKKAGVRVSSKAHTPNSLTVSSTWLIFQEKVILEQGKIRRDFKKCFAKMDEDGDLKNRIRIKMD
jgi:hypothetical protein